MMEYFWYILASVLAGVGTGLVGLSAATVIVPILIVLCPSFAGETEAYQATAIALVSARFANRVDSRTVGLVTGVVLTLLGAAKEWYQASLMAMPWHHCLLLVLAASVFGAYTELISKNGYDMVTVPLVNTAVLLALHAILEAAPIN